MSCLRHMKLERSLLKLLTQSNPQGNAASCTLGLGSPVLGRAEHRVGRTLLDGGMLNRLHALLLSSACQDVHLDSGAGPVRASLIPSILQSGDTPAIPHASAGTCQKYHLPGLWHCAQVMQIQECTADLEQLIDAVAVGADVCRAHAQLMHEDPAGQDRGALEVHKLMGCAGAADCHILRLLRLLHDPLHQAHQPQPLFMPHLVIEHHQFCLIVDHNQAQVAAQNANVEIDHNAGAADCHILRPLQLLHRPLHQAHQPQSLFMPANSWLILRLSF